MIGSPTEHLVKDTVSIVQLNARSLTRRAAELRLLIATNPVDIIAVQETWLSDKVSAPELSGYFWYGVNRDHTGGGVGLYVRESIRFSVVRAVDVSPLEAATVSIQTCEGRRLLLSSIYVPPNTSPDTVCRLARLRLRSSLLIGDFNAHHGEWSQGRESERGRVLRRFCSEHQLDVHSSREHPTYHGGRGRPSSPDFVIAGPYVPARVTAPSVLADVGSDHLPVLTLLQCNTERLAPSAEASIWRQRTLAVQPYREHLQTALRRWRALHEPRVFSPSAAYTAWVRCVTEAAERFCQRAKPRRRRGNPKWYQDSPEVRKLIRERRRLRRRAQQHRDLASYRAYQHSCQTTESAIQLAKDREWERHCSSFSEVNMFARLRGTLGAPTVPEMISDRAGELLTSDLSIADELCNHFSSVGDSLPPAEVPASQPAALEFPECHAPITRDEVQSEIQKLQRRKAAGCDGVFTFMIIDGGAPVLDSLVYLFQSCWHRGWYPASWTVAKIKPIKKSPKAQSVSEFRPISLTPVVAKIFESIIRSRLTLISTRNGWIPSYQAGFRPKRSIIEHLIQLQMAGHTAFRRKEFLLAAFLDLSKAYDTVSRPLLLSKLQRLGIDGPMIFFLRAFLGNRTGAVSYRSAVSETREFRNGVPQGSPLSPLLFTIYIAQALADSEAERCAYADDLALWVSAPTLEAAETQLSAALEPVYRWSTAHRMQFSAEKCVVLTVSQRGPRREPDVRMGPIRLRAVPTAPYLGVIFDRTLSFKPQVDSLAARRSRAMIQFQLLTHCRTGVHQHILLRLYCACLRPALEYASSVWGDASTTQLSRVESLQHRTLCKALGVNRLSHRADVAVEAGVPPTAVRRKVEILRIWAQLWRQAAPYSKVLDSFPPGDLYRSPRRISFLLRLQQLTSELNISLESAKHLNRAQLDEILRQLWISSRAQRQGQDDQDGRRARREVGPNDAVGRDDRIAAYASLSSGIDWYRPTAYRSTARPVLAIWHMLRLGTAPLNGFLSVIDDTRDGSCSCGHASETVQHYLLDCERYTAQRTALATSVRAQVPTFACLSVPRLLGDPDRLSTAQLDSIFVAVTSFITATERFRDLIIPEGRPPD